MSFVFVLFRLDSQHKHSFWWNMGHKPIFHYDTKPFALGPRVGLSLYSTRTQNTWCWGLALGNTPDASILCWGYQHVGIFWHYPRRQSPTPILKFALPPTPTPDASQWNIGGVGSWRWVFALGMYISCIR